MLLPSRLGLESLMWSLQTIFGWWKSKIAFGCYLSFFKLSNVFSQDDFDKPSYLKLGSISNISIELFDVTYSSSLFISIYNYKL